MKNEISKHFASVIGQENTKNQLINSALSGANGGCMLQPLIEAQAGNGKTRITHSYMNALRSLGFNVLSVTPDEIRTEDTATAVFDLIRDTGKKFCLHIDEAHLLRENKNRTVWIDAVTNTLMKMLDANNFGRPIDIREGVESVTFSPNRGTVIATTNYPEKLDKKGAFQSRFNRMELDLYNENELVQILIQMLEEKGFKNLNEHTLGVIARCGRGTARPLEKIVGQLEIIHNASGKRQKTLNAEDVMESLIAVRLYPRGLSTSEIQILQMGIGNRLRDKVIYSALPKLEPNALRNMSGYLYALGFMDSAAGGISTTPKGAAYLEKVKQEKFPMPVVFS